MPFCLGHKDDRGLLVPERIPPGAFADCAKLEKSAFGPRPALDARAKALSEMRTAVNEHDLEISDLQARLTRWEETLRTRPF
jgi:hypothetical protein